MTLTDNSKQSPYRLLISHIDRYLSLRQSKLIWANKPYYNIINNHVKWGYKFIKAKNKFKKLFCILHFYSIWKSNEVKKRNSENLKRYCAWTKKFISFENWKFEEILKCLLYHFLESLDVINLSFLIELDDVADVREPVRVEELPGLVFPIEITFHHQRFSDANRTGFAGSDKFSGILRQYDLEKPYFLMVSGIFVKKKITIKILIENLFTSILKAHKNLIINNFFKNSFFL